MTPVKFHKDSFFDPSLSGSYWANNFTLPLFNLPAPSFTDSFERGTFDTRFNQQIRRLGDLKKQINQQLSGLKNDNEGKTLKEKLILERADLENQEKLLALIAEQMEKSAQVIASNFR